MATDIHDLVARINNHRRLNCRGWEAAVPHSRIGIVYSDPELM